MQCRGPYHKGGATSRALGLERTMGEIMDPSVGFISLCIYKHRRFSKKAIGLYDDHPIPFLSALIALQRQEKHKMTTIDLGQPPIYYNEL